ncbi:MAG: OmpA family protein [Bacteroidales bacterium]|nr:OmpA family protein [Bacteroidales bacterium]MDD2323371.1 OmpA family protein [Bacteroidales bacterium]MDD3962275.1 OmpA family protein [Bacteroidales bacterium]MDY0286024.1 OmpA family protein [Bacteroidales bacterium]HPE86497.1 OmpA family protein [Bacteroidales bacterium]
MLTGSVIQKTEAQTVTTPWSFSMGTNFIDLTAPQFGIAKQVRNANWEGSSTGLPLHLAVGRRINSSLAFQVSYGMVKLENVAKYGKGTPLEKYNLNITDPYFWSLFGQLAYNFANGYLIQEESRVNPYLTLGGGNTRLSRNDHWSVLMGTGINFRTEDVGFTAELGYVYIGQRDDYIRFTMGINIFIGKKKKMPSDEPAKSHLTKKLTEIPQEKKEDEGEDKGITITINIGTMNGMQPAVETTVSKPREREAEETQKGIEPMPEPKEKPLEEQPMEELFDHIEKGPIEKTKTEQHQPTDITAQADYPPGQRIHFDIDKYAIKPESYPYLNEIAKRLREHPGYKIRIEGYTDNTYTRQYNLELSESRAFAVQQYLLKQGVSPQQILPPRGFGEDFPLRPNDSEIHRAINRRTELSLITL